jgi:hypothetical protein
LAAAQKLAVASFHLLDEIGHGVLDHVTPSGRLAHETLGSSQADCFCLVESPDAIEWRCADPPDLA